MVGAGYGLKLAVAAGAPVRVADEVMDRLAVPVHGEDVHAPFLLPAADRPPGRPGQRRRFGPRNMAFTDGLDRWELAGSFLDAGRRTGRTIPAPPQTGPRSWPPQSPNPLVRPSCSRRSTPRTTAAPRSPSAGSCAPPAWPARPGCIWPRARPTSLPAHCLRDRGGSSLTGPGSSDWTWHEVTMPIPGDAGVIWFGISLTGRGRIELRNPELSQARKPGS